MIEETIQTILDTLEIGNKFECTVTLAEGDNPFSMKLECISDTDYIVITSQGSTNMNYETVLGTLQDVAAFTDGKYSEIAGWGG